MDIVVPKTAEEALSGSQVEEWRDAMLEELPNMEAQSTWEIVKRQRECYVIGSRWVFAVKKVDGKVVRFKARLVAQGFRQMYGIDYQETFSPVVQRKTLRILMAIAIENDWEMVHLDVVGAYLNSDLDTVIYMEQPPGFASCDADRFVCKLKKSIYGLKQAGRNWNHHLHGILTRLGFTQSVKDSCVYVRTGVIIAVYVDDFLLVGTRSAIG